MNKKPSLYELKIPLEAREEQKAFFDSFSKETDRGLAIVSVCFLDYMLEKLIRFEYRKDPKINILFKDNNVLQPYYNKVCISYFSGLISEPLYHDLKLVGEIRNKFAHTVTDTFSFNDVSITKKIDRFIQIPPDYINIYPPRLRFLLITIHMGVCIQGLRYGREQGLKELGLKEVVHFCNIDLATLRSCILKPQDIEKLTIRKPDKK